MAGLFHPEYFKAIEPLLPAMSQAQKPPIHDVLSRRATTNEFFGSMMKTLPSTPGVEITIHQALAQDGYSIPIYHYRKTGTATNAPVPAILHTHGGGYFALDAATFQNSVAATVAATGIQIFSVDYRLTPEHQFPVPIEDCYAGLLWLHEHASEFSIDLNRVAVYGESAGGGLAAGVAVMARDRKLSPPLAKQVLIYPMLDDRNVKTTPIDKYLVWDYTDNITAWTAYLGENAGKDGVSPYAAPARLETVEGLPPTYIDVGTLDFFRDEDIHYAARLAAANIPTELHLYPGVPHGFEVFARSTDLVARALANRVKALTSF